MNSVVVAEDQPSPRLSREQLASLQKEIEELRAQNNSLLARSEHASPAFAFFLVVEAIIIFFYYLGTDYPNSKAVSTTNPLTNVTTIAASTTAAEHIALYYPMFQDVHVMIFVGFGFLMTFLKKYGYSATGINMLIAAVACQIAPLVIGLATRVADGSLAAGTSTKILLDIPALFNAEFAAGAVLISFGAVLGKLSPTQMLVMTIWEVCFYAINFALVYTYFRVNDVGGSMTIHVFGAFFGLSCSYFASPSDVVERSEDNTVTSISDVFSMIGTIFLYIYWPSFNAVTAAPGDPQTRAVINTYLALTSSVFMAFIWSRLLRHDHKFNMVDVQNATLAGGVAMGASADMRLTPFIAIIVGCIAGTVSVFGFSKLQAFLLEKIGLHDTCGVLNLHGMPGLIGGLVSIIFAAAATAGTCITCYGLDLYVVFPQLNPASEHGARTASVQAGYQAVGLAVSLGIGLFAGSICGLLLRCSCFERTVRLFNDAEYFEVPHDDGTGLSVVPAEFLAEKAALAAEKELAEKIELAAKQSQADCMFRSSSVELTKVSSQA